MPERKSAVVVLNDLMFRVRIDEALKRAGFATRFASSPAEALHLALSGVELIVIDLNFDAANPLELIRELKSNEQTSRIPLLGYVSHVQTEIRRKAQERGCDQVVPRSALVPALLRANFSVAERERS
jgi:CheY-like chemotaxis protein